MATFMIGLTVYPCLASQAIESQTTPAWKFNSTSVPDFRIEATLPNIVVADGTTPATSTIIVNPIADFTGTVTLSDFPLPTDLKCKSVNPTTIPNGSGQANLSCSSTISGTYRVTIIGTSDGIKHNATATFTFATSTSPDFAIALIAPVSLTSGTTATSNVTLTAQGGFESQVNLTAVVYPSVGLSVSLNPQKMVLGSGLSTATFSSSTPGDYTVTITGTSKSLSHTTMVVVAVTLVVLPDFRISASSSSINIEVGNRGSARIIITPSNGFTSVVSLVVAAPAGVSCSLSPTSVQSSGESTLTCNGSRAGDYSVTIRATGAVGPHITTVDVHVAAVSPAAPAPSTTLRLSPAVFLGIIGVIIIVVVVGTVLGLRRSRRSKS